jgi:hypothetical protein
MMSTDSPKTSMHGARFEELQNRHPSSDVNNSEQHPRNFGGMILNRVDEAPLAVGYKKEIASPGTLGPPEKEKGNEGSDSPAVEESTEARLERLGRQRPEVFDSVWSEIGFVFAISMSQVLTVSTSLHGPFLSLTSK